jgi:nucleotide-binding universal stress UspA family protein
LALFTFESLGLNASSVAQLRPLARLIRGRDRLEGRSSNHPGSRTDVYRNIVVAYDGSEGAEAALRSAVAMAGAGGGTIHLIHCTGHLQSADREVMQEDPDAAAAARRALEEAAEQLDEVSVVTSFTTGHPVSELIDAAERLRADLIVMGSRGRAIMPEAVLGRVTSGVVSNAPCDVLVVQPGS